MILVQAAPDQMAIIDKAIEQIDVPIEAGNSLLQNMNRMKVYRLETVDPQSLVDLLQELGDMDPGTVLKVDEDKKSILAWGQPGRSPDDYGPGRTSGPVRSLL